jgi:hypothetical protein
MIFTITGPADGENQNNEMKSLTRADNEVISPIGPATAGKVCKNQESKPLALNKAYLK